MKKKTSTIKINMSVSRWLKVDDLLSKVLYEHNGRITKAFCYLRISRYLSREEENHIEKMETDGRNALRVFRLVQEARLTIRDAIDKRNLDNGVSSALARIKILDERSNLISEIINEQVSEMITVDSLKEILDETLELDDIPYSLKKLEVMLFGPNYEGVKIRILKQDDVDDLRAELQKLSIEILDLKSEIAEKNSQKLSVEIEREVADFFSQTR